MERSEFGEKRREQSCLFPSYIIALEISLVSFILDPFSLSKFTLK